MIQRNLRIGRWWVEFYFCPDGYDTDYLIERLYNSGAGSSVLHDALALMESGNLNQGFTFANRYDKIAIVVIGPASNGAEFQNTITHEVLHLAISIADALGVNLLGETPAYIAGDSIRELANVVCELGCNHCN